MNKEGERQEKMAILLLKNGKKVKPKLVSLHIFQLSVKKTSLRHSESNLQQEKKKFWLFTWRTLCAPFWPSRKWYRHNRYRCDLQLLDFEKRHTSTGEDCNSQLDTYKHSSKMEIKPSRLKSQCIEDNPSRLLHAMTGNLKSLANYHNLSGDLAVSTGNI